MTSSKKGETSRTTRTCVAMEHEDGLYPGSVGKNTICKSDQDGFQSTSECGDRTMMERYAFVSYACLAMTLPDERRCDCGR